MTVKEKPSKLQTTLGQMSGTDNLHDYIPQIVDRLRPLEPDKVIVFGSYAEGNPTVYSDLDVLVVTKSEHLPRSYADRESIYFEVARVLRDIRAQIPMDLIVHTRAMHSAFLATNSLFAREILRKGQVVYEGSPAHGLIWRKMIC